MLNVTDYHVPVHQFERDSNNRNLMTAWLCDNVIDTRINIIKNCQCLNSRIYNLMWLYITFK